MSKMGLYCSFGHLKHKLWPKEGPGVKLAVWLPTTKSQESTRFPCVKITCDIPLKSSRRELQLCFRPHSIRGLHAKLWHPKVARVPTLVISRLPLGSFETKSHLDVGPVERCRVYYKGEGSDFPQVRAVMSLVYACCPWPVLAPKVLQLCTNHLALVLCRFVWVNEACQLFLVPSRSSTRPSTPSKCCEPRSMPGFFTLSLFSI